MNRTTKRFPRTPLLAGVLCVLALAACDDDPPPASRVTTIEVISGNNQQGPVGQALAQPLVARALDTSGRAVSGAQLQWSVTAGGGQITAASTTTDANGQTTATWTLGTGAGQQTAAVQIGNASQTFVASAQAGAATTLTVAPDAFTLDAIGATRALEVEAEDAHGNPIPNPAPAWTSLDTDVATVSAAGVVTAAGPGTTTIRATLDGVTAESEVTVDPQPASVVVTPANPQLDRIGATVQLAAEARDANDHPVEVDAGEFTWTSSNPNVIEVSATGLATGLAAGSADVNATLATITGGTSVSVVQAIAHLVVTPQIDTVTTAEPSVIFTAVATDPGGHAIPNPTVTWSTSNPAIAIVSAAGVATGLSNGTAWIRAASGAVRDSATLVVRLNAAPTARADTFGSVIDTPRQVAAPGVLANDTTGIPAGVVTSFGGGSLGGNAFSNPAGATVNFGTGGSLTLNADGSLSFTPSAGFAGEFKFQYIVQNVVGAATAEVTIQVGAGTSAVDDNYVATAGVTLVVDSTSGLLSNDQRGFPLASIVSFGGGTLPGDATTYTAGQTIAFGVGGSLTVSANGAFSFTPPQNTANVTFRYRLANQSDFSEATVVVVVN